MDGLNSPPTASNSYYTPLILSLIGVFSTCVALVVYHFIVIKYCKRTETTRSGEAQQVTQAPVLPTGIDEKVLETIPIIAYSSTKEESDDDERLFRVDQSECVVCLGELEHGELVRLLPDCKHAFHVSCIDEWFVAHTSCPICRSPIVAATPAVNNDIPSPPPPLPITSSYVDGSNRIELPGEDHDHGSTAAENNDVASSSGIKGQSFRLLRHCGSLVLPRERPSSSGRLITGLKRSLSLDQSSVIIDIQRESSRDGSSSSSSKNENLVTSASSSTVGARSIRHLDRVSTKLRSSFSRLRLGKNAEILPY